MEGESGLVPIETTVAPKTESPAERVNNNLTVVKNAPKLGEVMTRPETRDNVITAQPEGRFGKVEERQTFTEKQGLENLVSFVNQVAEKAQEVGNLDLKKQAEAFRDNLVYIGEPELREATQGMATHVKDLVQSGKNVYLYHYSNRSERYIALRLLEEFDYQTEENPNLREKVHATNNIYELTTKLINDPDLEVLIIDDFAISGSRVKGYAENIVYELIKAGVEPTTAVGRTEVCLVAVPIRENDSPHLNINSADIPLKTFAYFGVPEYRNENGKWYVFPGISLSSSHSSTDYGFEMVIEEFKKFDESRGITQFPPLPANIVRPYETNVDKTYEDPTLQARWEKINSKYGLKSPLTANA